VDAEPAVLKRFLFFRKTLDPAPGCREDAIVVVGHDDAKPRIHQYVRDEYKREILPEYQ
jgi:hypothetical protein